MTMDEHGTPDDAASMAASSALARLQAADPAGPDPDLTDLQARILAAQVDEAATDAADGIVVPLARRRAWLLPAAAGVAAIALAGAGLVGYSAGRNDTTIVAAPPVAANAPAAEAAKAAGDAAALDGTAVDGNAGNGNAMTLSPAAAPPATTMLATPTVWIAAGSLPDAPSVGTGYRVVPDDIDPVALAGELAQGLGVDGPVVPQDGGWRVGDDPSGPSVWVSDDALLSWSFSDPTVPATGTAMDAGRATAVARALLRDIGVPMAMVDWQVMQVDGVTTVTAWHTVAGVRTQLAWTVTLAPDGRLVGATGFASALQPIPGYELVGAATAVDRISQPGWLALAPTPVSPGQVSSAGRPSAPAVSPLMNGRPTLTVPVSSVTVSGSTIGLSPYREPDGSMLVLPSYLLTDDTGATWSLLAVADRYVRFAEPGPVDPADLAAR